MTLTSQLQTSPYLRTQRQFPNENVRELANQMDHSYIDIAQKVNARTIGLYAVGFPIITGEQWFLKGQPQKQQTLRQVYPFTSAGSIVHGINFASLSQFTKCFGSFTDGTNYYGTIYGSNISINGQVSFYITPTNIIILSGAGAPTITSGTIILEWLSQF